MRVPDHYDFWEEHDREQNRKNAALPVCVECGEAVQDDHYFLINDEVICPNCLESNYRKEVDDFYE